MYKFINHHHGDQPVHRFALLKKKKNKTNNIKRWKKTFNLNVSIDS